MPSIRPFIGLLYDTSVAGPFDRLTTPPYDAIPPRDHQRFRSLSPYNAISLITGRGPAGGAPSSRYTRAAEHLQAWRSDGALALTDRPAVYPYEFRFHDSGHERRVRGVIAAVDLEPFGAGVIPHERTLPGPLHDRMAVLRAVRANLSPIYAVFDGPAPELAALLAEVTATAPARETEDESGTRHRLWVSPEGTGPAERAADALRRQPLMIADGHHRYTVALAHRDQMRASHGPGPWDAMMVLLVDAATEDPPVLPIHRLVKDPPTVPELAAWGRGERVRDLAEVLATVDDDARLFGMVRIEDGEVIHRVAALDEPAPTVRALHDAVLNEVRPGRLRFVTDAVAGEEAVRGRRAATCYILPATRVERIREVIASGGRLPEKSTLFWPKPRTGMVIRPFDL